MIASATGYYADGMASGWVTGDANITLPGGAGTINIGVGGGGGGTTTTPPTQPAPAPAASKGSNIGMILLVIFLAWLFFRS